jgi:hypothetical protein
MTKNRNRRRGNTIVEAALALLLALVILIGLIDFGQLLMRQQAFVERVRAGCRYAVTRPYNAQEIRNVVVYGDPAPGVASAPPDLRLERPWSRCPWSIRRQRRGASHGQNP